MKFVRPFLPAAVLSTAIGCTVFGASLNLTSPAAPSTAAIPGEQVLSRVGASCTATDLVLTAASRSAGTFGRPGGWYFHTLLNSNIQQPVDNWEYELYFEDLYDPPTRGITRPAVAEAYLGPVVGQGDLDFSGSAMRLRIPLSLLANHGSDMSWNLDVYAINADGTQGELLGEYTGDVSAPAMSTQPQATRALAVRP